MSEFVCGFIFFVIGVALLVYNKQLVQRSNEFYTGGLSSEETTKMDGLNRTLCFLSGLIVSVAGFLTMLASRK